MVIGEHFVWGHMPKTGGEATRAMFALLPELIVYCRREPHLRAAHDVRGARGEGARQDARAQHPPAAVLGPEPRAAQGALGRSSRLRAGPDGVGRGGVRALLPGLAAVRLPPERPVSDRLLAAGGVARRRLPRLRRPLRRCRRRAQAADRGGRAGQPERVRTRRVGVAHARTGASASTRPTRCGAASRSTSTATCSCLSTPENARPTRFSPSRCRRRCRRSCSAQASTCPKQA